MALRYKAVFTDYDDTMIGRDGKPGRMLTRRIAEYERAGGKFRIATGRMTSSIRPICLRLGLRGELISFQGGVISDIETGKIRRALTIPFEKAYEACRLLESLGLYFQTYRNGMYYAERSCELFVRYGRIAQARGAALGYPISEYISRDRYAPPKILAMVEPKDRDGLIARIASELGDSLIVNTSKPYIIEIVPGDSGKGAAVKAVAEMLGISREEVICAGDSDNDLSMLEYAGLGVCVANGSESAKRAADVIGPDCDSDPISWILESYGRLEGE